MLLQKHVVDNAILLYKMILLQMKTTETFWVSCKKDTANKDSTLLNKLRTRIPLIFC